MDGLSLEDAMFAASFMGEVGTNLLITALVAWWLLSKFIKSNPSVGDAAKQAAANKAIDIIKQWFK
jgi:hypothetical protein